MQSFDLSAARALALVKVAREVASGRVDLHAPDHERGWARLRKIPGIGSWTIAVLALHGQGRHDVLPAGDLAYIKLVGRAQAGGRPSARATEEEVLAYFARYEGWTGLAGLHALGVQATGGAASLRFARGRLESRGPAGTRWSATSASGWPCNKSLSTIHWP